MFLCLFYLSVHCIHTLRTYTIHSYYYITISYTICYTTLTTNIFIIFSNIYVLIYNYTHILIIYLFIWMAQWFGWLLFCCVTLRVVGSFPTPLMELCNLQPIDLNKCAACVHWSDDFEEYSNMGTLTNGRFVLFKERICCAISIEGFINCKFCAIRDSELIAIYIKHLLMLLFTLTIGSKFINLYKVFIWVTSMTRVFCFIVM